MTSPIHLCQTAGLSVAEPLPSDGSRYIADTSGLSLLLPTLHSKMSAVPYSRWLLHLPEPTGDWKQRWLACSNDGEPGSIVLTPPLSSAPICHHSAGWSCLQCFSPQMRWVISCPSRMLHSCHPRLLLPPCSWQFWHLVISLLLLHLDPYPSPPFFLFSFILSLLNPLPVCGLREASREDVSQDMVAISTFERRDFS